MKKFVLCVLILCSCVTIQANDSYYFEIYGSHENVEELYTIKKELLNDFKEWSKGMDQGDYEQILKDHLYLYDEAYYQNHTIVIVLGEKEKVLKGELKVNYCEENIKVKSLILEWLGRY